MEFLEGTAIDSDQDGVFVRDSGGASVILTVVRKEVCYVMLIMLR